MLKKLIIGLSVFVGLILIISVARLLILRHSIGTYAKYWQTQANQPAQKGEFVYVVLGDSIAQAIGASTPQKGYVGQVASHIEQQTGRHVHIINLSVTGATIHDLLQNQLPQLHKYKPDLVTVEIGANDMRSYNHDRFKTEYEQFIQALPSDRSVITNMPYFGTRKAVNPHALDANKTIADLAATHQVPLVGIYTPLKQQQSPLIYAADFFHPSDRGYHIWYKAFEPAVEQAIR